MRGRELSDQTGALRHVRTIFIERRAPRCERARGGGGLHIECLGRPAGYSCGFRRHCIETRQYRRPERWHRNALRLLGLLIRRLLRGTSLLAYTRLRDFAAVLTIGRRRNCDW